MFVFPHSLKGDAAVARQSRCRALTEAVEIYRIFHGSGATSLRERASATWTQEGEQRWVNNRLVIGCPSNLYESVLSNSSYQRTGSENRFNTATRGPCLPLNVRTHAVAFYYIFKLRLIIVRYINAMPFRQRFSKITSYNLHLICRDSYVSLWWKAWMFWYNNNYLNQCCFVGIY